MNSDKILQIITGVKKDESRLQVIERLPEETQEQYASGIVKLRRRICEERAVLGITTDDTEAWAKGLLDDFPYEEHPESMRRIINQYLEKVELARESCDVDVMKHAQHQLELLVEEALRPTQLRLDDAPTEASVRKVQPLLG